MMRIIDFHTHAFPKDLAPKVIDKLEGHYNVKIDNRGTLPGLIAKVAEAQVYKSVLHASATKPKQVPAVNNWVGAISSPVVVKFGTLHPDYEAIDEELRRLKEMGIKGIKLHPDFQQIDLISKKMYSLYEKIDSDFLILFHVGDDVPAGEDNYSTPRKLAQIISDFPDLNIIAGHLGGYKMWNEAEEHLIGKDLYLDTSSVFHSLSFKRGSKLIKAHGVDKILFGSDYPMGSPIEEIENIFKLNLNIEEKWKILTENGCRLLTKLDIM